MRAYRPGVPSKAERCCDTPAPRAQKSHPRVGRPEPGSAIAPVAWCKLGYPLYMTTIPGARKVLSILGLAVPRFPRLKEFGLCRSHFRLFWRDFSSSTVADGLDNVAVSGRCRAVTFLWCRSSASRTITESASGPPSPIAARALSPQASSAGARVGRHALVPAQAGLGTAPRRRC